MKMTLTIKRKLNKSRSTHRTKIKSRKRTGKWLLLPHLSPNRKLFQAEKRSRVKATPAEIQRSQKTQSRLKLSSAQ